MKRLNVRIPEDIAQFVDDYATELATRLGYSPKQQPPKGEVVSGIIRGSKQFKKWSGNE